MKLVVSNIAWTNEEEIEVVKKLQELGVKYIEIAPTKKWENPINAPTDEVKAYKKFWQAHGIRIVAFQSMLFTRPDLKIFDGEANRQESADYLKKFTRLAHDLGAGVMVYGSPKNRQRGDKDMETANLIAKDFFKEIGDNAAALNVEFCIEPNPTAYACDFVVNTVEGIELVNAVDSPGFGLHLDIAGMTLANDDIAKSIKAAAPVLRHFHISAPYLEQVDRDSPVDHATAAKALIDVGYEGFVSIEMKPGEVGTNLERVERAVLFAQKTYPV